MFFHKKAGVDTPASISSLDEKLRLRGKSQDAPLRWRVDEKSEPLSINPNYFLPQSLGRWYHYQGSLTSGTFSEDVSWFVMGPEIGVGPEHVKALEERTQQDAWVVPAGDRRFVLRSFARTVKGRGIDEFDEGRARALDERDQG